MEWRTPPPSLHSAPPRPQRTSRAEPAQRHASAKGDESKKSEHKKAGKKPQDRGDCRRADALLGGIPAGRLYDPFEQELRTLVCDLSERGMNFYALSGERTPRQQAALYAQGRTKPGSIVTNAGPFESSHNFAVAADLVADANERRPGLQASWNLSEYYPLARTAERLGLEAGLYWDMVDGPHVQLPLGEKGLSFSELEGAYERGGKTGVFRKLDREKW